MLNMVANLIKVKIEAEARQFKVKLKLALYQTWLRKLCRNWVVKNVFIFKEQNKYDFLQGYQSKKNRYRFYPQVTTSRASVCWANKNLMHIWILKLQQKRDPQKTLITQPLTVWTFYALNSCYKCSGVKHKVLSKNVSNCKKSPIKVQKVPWKSLGKVQ